MLLPGKRLIGLLPLLLISFFALSQEISPYSRFGLGQVHNTVFSSQRGLGGVAAAYRDPFHINFMNPASYTSLVLTTFEVGGTFTTKTIEDGQTGATYKAGDGYFDYIALGFPIKKAGLSVGLVPYSNMSYNYLQSRTYDVGSAKKLYEGNGRTYQLYLGGAYRFQKIDTSRNSLSLGMNFSYIFGNLNRNNIVQFSPTDYYNTRVTSTTRLSNFAMNVGLQYKRKFSSGNYAMVGAYSFFPVVVGSTEQEIWSRYIRITSGIVNIDTVYGADADAPNVKIPVETGAGISFGRMGKWMIGAEVKYKIWTDIESYSPDVTLENSWEFRGGAELRPSADMNRGFFKRVAYRVGGFYDNGYLNIDGTKISEMGGTFGFALPLKTSFARLNFSFDAGTRGTTANELVKETFFRAYIGFTLNDKWFLKPKYD